MTKDPAKPEQPGDTWNVFLIWRELNARMNELNDAEFRVASNLLQCGNSREAGATTLKPVTIAKNMGHAPRRDRSSKEPDPRHVTKIINSLIEKGWVEVISHGRGASNQNVHRVIVAPPKKGAPSAPKLESLGSGIGSQNGAVAAPTLYGTKNLSAPLSTHLTAAAENAAAAVGFESEKGDGEKSRSAYQVSRPADRREGKAESEFPEDLSPPVLPPAHQPLRPARQFGAPIHRGIEEPALTFDGQPPTAADPVTDAINAILELPDTGFGLEKATELVGTYPGITPKIIRKLWKKATRPGVTNPSCLFIKTLLPEEASAFIAQETRKATEALERSLRDVAIEERRKAEALEFERTRPEREATAQRRREEADIARAARAEENRKAIEANAERARAAKAASDAARQAVADESIAKLRAFQAMSDEQMTELRDAFFADHKSAKASFGECAFTDPRKAEHGKTLRSFMLDWIKRTGRQIPNNQPEPAAVAG